MKDLIKINKPLILASQSPRRKLLLRQIGLEFDIVPSLIDENEYPISNNPIEYAVRLASLKANDVATRTNYPAIVIGSDTIVVIDGQILNKPKDEDDARRMLKMLSGDTHIVYTAVSIVDRISDRELTDVRATSVTFRNLTDREIDAYIQSGSPLDKAGSYGIQDDFGAVFISHIEGCYYNIVGLPLEMLYSMLQQFGD